MKTAKFLLCENPIANEANDGRTFIFHNRKPRLLAEVFHFDSGQEVEIMECKRAFTVGSSLDYGEEQIILGRIWVEEFHEGGTQQEADNLAGLMRRMADWYMAYLIWEDGQED